MKLGDEFVHISVREPLAMKVVNSSSSSSSSSSSLSSSSPLAIG